MARSFEDRDGLLGETTYTRSPTSLQRQLHCQFFGGSCFGMSCAVIVLKNPEQSSRGLPPITESGESATKPKSCLTSCANWTRLLCVWVCCTLAAGIMPGQAVFSTMFAEVGVFADACKGSETYPCGAQIAVLNEWLGLGLMVSLCAQLPVGMIFDIHGGRTVGIVGAALVSVGLAFMAVPVFSALNGTDSTTNWIVPVAALITDFGSLLNSFCFFGMIWHYPGNTAVILSLNTATYQISALLPVLLQFVMDRTDLHFGYAILVFAATVLSSVGVLWKLVPSQQEYYDSAKEILGMPLPKPKKKFEPCTMLCKGWQAVRLDLRDHAWLCLAVATCFCFCQLYNTMSFAYGSELFGSKESGKTLAFMQVESTAAVGAICAPIMANFADCLGLQRFAWVLLLFVGIPLGFFWVAKWWAAWVTTIGLILFSTMFQLFLNRYMLCYAPPNRLGVYAGVFSMLMMVSMLPLYFGMFQWMSSSGEFFKPFLVSGSVGVVILIIFNCRFCFVHNGKGVPALPMMLEEDEMELAMQFGAKNLDEAAQILGMDKDSLYKRLSSPNYEDLIELYSKIDTDAVAKLQGQYTPEEMIQMLETGPELEDEDEEEIEVNGATHSCSKQAKQLAAAFRSPESNASAFVNAQQKLDKEDFQIALAECFEFLVLEGDVEGCKRYVLEVPIEDQWDAALKMEDWEESRKQTLDQKSKKVITGKVYAGLLRERPELKKLVSRMMQRELQKAKQKFKDKFRRK